MSNSPKYAKAVAMIKRIINLIFLFIPRAAKIPWAEGIIVSDVRGPLTHRMPLFCRAASWEWCTLNGNGTKRRFYSALSAMRHLCIVRESWPVVIAPLARATNHSLSLSRHPTVSHPFPLTIVRELIQFLCCIYIAIYNFHPTVQWFGLN